MNKTAYDMCYYDSMIQKNRYLFKLIARNMDEPFRVIEDYMKSDYRKAMDRGNPLYLNKTPKQILGSIGIRIKPEAGINEKYDEFILEWMADVYTYMQWKYDLKSEDIADKNKEQESEFTKDKNSDRWDGDLNSRSNNLSRQVEEKEEEIKAGLKANNSPKGKAAEEKLAKKNATRWSSLLGIPVGIRAVGTCPGCGKKTIYQSMTAIDLIIFKAILSLTKSPLNVYFCMNSGKNCRLSFEKGMCWMCAGKFEPTTMPVPYPLKLFRFNK